MSYQLKIKRYKVEALKEEAWRVVGGPRRTIKDEELAELLCVSPSTISRIKAGGNVSGTFVAAIQAVFKTVPDLTEDLWYIEEPEMEAAA